ncbi:MAG: amidohydrolase [Clostridia bacterium]|nr:amidohydrolase [Clostridia bacterium]
MYILIKDVNALLRKGRGSYAVEKTNILISGGKIESIGENISVDSANTVIDGAGKLAMPGLINCHTHVYMTVLRSLADDLPFGEWLFGRVMPNEEKLTSDDAYYSSLYGCLEMLSSGTTAFMEMHMFEGAVARAATDAGMRCVLSRGLTGTMTDGGGKRRLDEATREMRDYAGNSLLSFAFGPHAVYTTDPEYLKHIGELARKHDILLNVHLSESVSEVNDCIAKYGCTPVEYLEKLGLFENRVIAAHCANVTDNDIKILADNKVNVALNIRSNMKLGNGIPPVAKLFDAGVNLCLGTDSAASNNSLNLFNELAAVTLITKGVERSPVKITAGEALDMATYNGASALGLGSGELAEGKNADIVLLDLCRPAFVPANDLVSSLAYSANGSEVDAVIVGGKIVIKDGIHISADMRGVAGRVCAITGKFEESKQ